MTIAPLIIACLALLFTVASFYWLQARKGRLRLYPVMTFSGSMSANQFILRIPVTIYNTGATPRVVTAMRLTLTAHTPEYVLECQTFRKTVQPKPDDTEDFAHPYVVAGRNVVTKHAHFSADAALPVLDGRPARFHVDALLDDRNEWARLGEVEVHTEIMHTAAYITYSNNSGVWSADLLKDAAKYQGGLPGHG